MTQPDRPIYLDCAATTPIDPKVRDIVLHYMDVDFGNAGSRTHIYGQEAAKAVRMAREQIASVVGARPEEVIFTSGATEANNLAILGLAEHGRKIGKKHIISTQIEHKAVLEPLHRLAAQGFEIEFIPPTGEGYIEAAEVAARIRGDTLLVTVMHVNNETGILQDIDKIADQLTSADVVFHVDASQGYGKEFIKLGHPRVDLISVSGHKLNAPQGIGCLIARRKRKAINKLSPLLIGGSQERGLRSGTLPVALIAGLGQAAQLAAENYPQRKALWLRHLYDFLSAIDEFPFSLHGNQERNIGTIINFSLSNIDSELIINALRNVVAISNGSACTSNGINPSYVISSMYSDSNIAHTACRASWCHLTPRLNIDAIKENLRPLF